MKTHNSNLKYDCKKCKDTKEKKVVDELNEEDRDDISESEDGDCEEFSNEILVHMENGNPWQRYKD